MTKRKNPPPRKLVTSHPVSIRLQPSDRQIIDDLTVSIGSEIAPAERSASYRIAAAVLAGVLDARPGLLVGVTLVDPQVLRSLGSELAQGER